MTDAEAIQFREQINTIRSDKAHPFHHPASPAHGAAVREMNSLHDKLYPNVETDVDAIG